MLQRVAYACIALLTLCAAAPQSSLIPEPRPQIAKPVIKASTLVTKSKRPLRRPDIKKPVKITDTGAIRSPKGSVCGVAAIKGVEVDTIRGKLPGCGIERPVKVQTVSGIQLSRKATLNCKTAKVLNDWVQNHAIPIVGKRGGGLEELHVVAHYSCRTRNNQPNAKLSEHSVGNAIDIAGFRLKDGTQVTVLDGWRLPSTRRMMKRLHKSACGPFGTVLGPDGDRFHQDHFHFDTAKRRSKAYCR